MDGTEALRQQRSGVVDVNGDVGACGCHVVTPNAAAGKDRKDGQKPAERKRAGAAVGDGGVGANAVRDMTAVPSNQRASDSHDDTRLGDGEDSERLASSRAAKVQRNGRNGANRFGRQRNSLVRRKMRERGRRVPRIET